MVPGEAPIFYFCEIGDLATVKQLLYEGKAGLLDVRHDAGARDVNGYETLLEAGFLHSHASESIY